MYAIADEIILGIDRKIALSQQLEDILDDEESIESLRASNVGDHKVSIKDN